MGGVMPYQRFRTRNGWTWRPTEWSDPYPPPDVAGKMIENMRTYPSHVVMLLGDLNRFERDVMGVGHNGDDLAERYAAIAGVDVETVRKVLGAVFDGLPDYPLPPVVALPRFGAVSDDNSTTKE